MRTLVEHHNCTFQEIDLQNDLGNDAYVKFVVEESATGCCVALQIKSGSSYRSAGGRYAFQSDRDHFEYWASHTLPVLAIIVDSEGSSRCFYRHQRNLNASASRGSPSQEIGEFMTAPREQRGVDAHALEFAVLTACRSGAVLKAA